MARPRTGAFDALRLPLAVGRSPLLPIERMCEIFAAADPLEALRVYLSREPLARQAIFVASPGLAAALDPWLAGQPPRTASVPLRALAYLSRMAARPTPFGMCAGIGEVPPGERTTLEIDDAARRTRTRPDMDVLAEAAKKIEAGDRRGNVRYVASDTIFERGGRLYVTNVALTKFAKTARSTASEQRPVSMKNTAAVRFVRDCAALPVTYDDIAARVAERFEAGIDDARRLVDKLVEAGVLISELRVSPLGDPVARFADRFETIDASAGATLRHALAGAAALDAMPLRGRDDAAYAAVERDFSALLDAPVHHALQIDLHAPFRGTLSERVFEDAERLAEYLMRLGAVPRLQAFRERFVARYEGEDRMVPLLELVDPNLGLGVPDDVQFEPAEIPGRDALLLRLACEALRTGAEEIELNERDVLLLVPPLPENADLSGLEVGFQVAAASPGAVERGEYSIVPTGFVGSKGPARSIGRFIDVLGERVLDRARHLARECVPHGLLAVEFAYVPASARSANVAIRPSLYDVDLCVAAGGARTPGAVAIDDLWVGLDRGQFFLWSASLQRRVVARESHVFATDRLAPNLCRFLSLLAEEGQRLIRPFTWGHAREFTYLPRVRAGRIVLAPRTWRFAKDALGGSASEAARALATWREQWNLPRHVLLSESDNTLFVDLDSPIAAALIFDQAGDAENVEFAEVLPSLDDTWVAGDTGRHVVEFVVSLLPRRAAKAAVTRAAPASIARRARRGPGSEWTYAKLYAGDQATDDLLLRRVGPLLTELRVESNLDRWFFVRYADPDRHVRLRFHVPHAQAGAARERFLESAETWLGEEALTRYALDTYDPEYERYGGVDRIEAAERFFTADSALCLALLAGLRDSTDARVAAAVESFVPWLLHGDASDLALDVFAGSAQRKLPAADRLELRRIGDRSLAPSEHPSLLDALAGEGRADRLASYFHMHCNRLALHGDGEQRAIALLRSLLLARRARTKNGALETVETA